MTVLSSRWIVDRTLLLAAMCAALVGCREEEDRTLHSTTASAEVQTADDWLDANSTQPPDQFLARLSGEEADTIGPLLAQATSRYREDPRMIANRIGQLWSFIHKDTPSVSVVQLLSEFTRIDAGPEQSIGPRIQQYRVLREQGAAHDEAIKQLERQVE